MRIIQKAGDPPTWEFNEVSEEERSRVTAFVEQWHGTVVNPWEPFLISFAQPAAVEAFQREFGSSLERP
ncbi:MAG TPA: hypothetical protein VHL79_03340 [Ramlibacter sp.]|jgi:hypothetical protein|nr:hypothetical protein [Ramlibacter sp.]